MSKHIANIDKNNTLIILDWDDTLFPTNWASKYRIELSTKTGKHAEHLNNLDIVLQNLLRILLQYGKVVIITNAMPEWIKHSSNKLPQTYSIVSQLKIISARKQYQAYSNDMMDWKEMAFKREVSIHSENKNFINIISIGDAEYEYNALVSLNTWNTNKKKLLKSIKFIKNPHNITIVDQLEVLSKAVPDIVNRQSHLDLVFDSKN